MISFVKAFKTWLDMTALSEGYIVQLYQWEDVQKIKPYIVIQPNGGGVMIPDKSSDHYLLVSLIASKQMGYTIEAKAREIIATALADPITEFGYLENLGGIPAPIFTEDNRMVLRLQFRIINIQP